jgi:hypothetical protein
MGWLQESVWNNAFMYAYPLSFIGSMAYGVLSVLQLDPSQVIANRNIVFGFNIFIGLCGLIGYSAWFSVDMSSVNTLTQYIDLDVNATRDKVVKQS